MRLGINSFLLFSLLAVHATSSPARIEKRSFKVDRVHNEAFEGHNGPRELYKARRKYGMSLPQGLRDAMARYEEEQKSSRRRRRRGNKGSENSSPGDCPNEAGEGSAPSQALPSPSTAPATTYTPLPLPTPPNEEKSGEVDAIPTDNDIEFLSHITIGGQTLPVVFDTGSSDLWVLSTALTSQSRGGRSPVYNPSASTTFSLLEDSTFSINYADGSFAAGIVGTDAVDIGGVSVTAQAVGVATEVSSSFVEDTPSSGLLGLAFPQLNTVQPVKQLTFFDNVLPELSEPVFTADLRRGSTGTYEFGRIDMDKFEGQLSWVGVNTTDGHWQFTSETFSVGKGEVRAGRKGAQAVVDTGTTLLLTDPVVVEAYYEGVKGAVFVEGVEGFVFPCDVELPDLVLDVGGAYMARVRGRDLNFAHVGNKKCFGGLQETEADGLQIFGDIFFKSQFVAFNGRNNSIGLAEQCDG